MNALGPVTVGGNGRLLGLGFAEFQQLVLVFLVNVPQPFA
jgi:hypothetical protein